MFSSISDLPRLAAGLALGILVSTPALAQGAEARLADKVRQIENALDARVGVLVRDSDSEWQWGHRVDERVLMNSTFKAMLCGAVLDRVDEGSLDLDEPLDISEKDILDYAPVTKARVGTAMSVGDLCLAAIDMSDNTATNLLIDRLGGPQEVTTFLRGIGDQVSRLDRREPELNTYEPGDPRDTTSPAAMLTTLEAVLLGGVLTPQSRTRLIDWMSRGSVTGGLIRASTPDRWRVADKSGSGAFSRNIVAMVTPPDDAPYFVAIYLSGANTDFDTRSAAVAELGKAVIDVLGSR